MFKFLFKGRGESAVVETKRQGFERIVSELNAAIDELADKPKVTLDPATGHVAFELPEQMPDEALALPAPSEVTAETEATPEPANDAPEASQEETKKVA